MKKFTLALCVTIVLASAFLCQQIITNSLSNQGNKRDYAELNHVKYGLFSVDEWKRQVTVILAEEINKLYLSGADERVLRKHIEVLLNTVIDQVAVKIREGNKGTAGGWVKQTFIDLFVSLEDVKKGIPDYADALIQEMTGAKTRGHLQTMLNVRLKEYFKQTFEAQDTAELKSILLRTGSKDIAGARSNLDQAIAAKQSVVFRDAILLIVLAVGVFALSGFCKEPLSPVRYWLLLSTLFMLLMVGVITPMIDMEAKISQMSFVLMGHPVLFENQVLYFQSKSILDVFWIMITHPDFLMQCVGVLLVTFSIIFPVLKLISSMEYFFNRRNARDNPVVRFFVLKSGKWSMADVLVVAMFMAYIGFNGIITSQFGQLSSEGQELVILTTNGTSLQPGFYLFVTYVLLALFLTGFLTRKPPAEP